MTAPHVWHLWSSRQWPASTVEESQFLSDLRALPGPSRTRRREVTPGRADMTAVLNALRCGIPAAELLRNLPGADPRALASAYDQLESSRQQAHTAWVELTGAPSWANVEQYAAAAAVLLPVPVHRILTVAAHTSGRSLVVATANVARAVHQHVAAADRLENALAHRTPPDPRAVALGARLHNPVSPALWGSAYFLPGRVTSLSPTRVADLLNERGNSEPARDL